MAPKLTTEADVRIGGRVRAAREAARLSQTDLSRHLGITFQQLQKNESGKNRISAVRLQAIADRLGVPLANFYDEPGPAFEPRPLTVREAEAALLAAAMALAEARAREAQTVTLAEAA